ncbi:anthranilate synthase component I family protein [Halovivax sp.]|uniref:anthranilate synthase component I family protein n=1 Tax=Halovivax sp. TaxID=1935978 RepID=UPI0025BC97A1|nr:anthranilate synthase component I family protein [Halovivax sp.]
MTKPRVATAVEDVRALAADAEPGTRLPVEVRLPVEDPFEAYRRARDGSGGVYLETTGGQRGWSYFGIDPIERLTVGPDAVALDADSTAPSGGSSTASGEAPTLAALGGLLDGESIARGDCDVPFPCGAIGWLSYDVARELEALPETTADDRDLPQLDVAVFDRLAAWEAPAEGPVTLRITACPRLGDGRGTGDGPDGVGGDANAVDDGANAVEDDPDAVYERGRERALELAEAILAGEASVGPPPADAPDATFESDCGREAFAERVRRVKEYVRDGDTFQANVSQRLVAPAAVHPVDAYDALRRVNPAPYSGLLEFRSVDLVSASPELLLERDGDLVRTEPIAGTRPRGRTPEADEALAEELRTDEKERAEHAMLVDLERNDLGKVCAYGTVEVSEYRRVDRYSEVMHLVSDVAGRLREGATLSDAIAAVFPGGTITGAPKPRTMEIIDELEEVRRGPYTGSVGIFGFDGRATLNIVIRTLVRHADEYHLRVGAGIVHDSEPYREYDETLDKARALITAIDEALGERAALTVDADDEAVSDGGERR